jgi:hypothetical protein
MEGNRRPREDDKSNAADRRSGERGGNRRSGEGAESALANLKRIERDRERTRPRDGDDSGSSRD